MKMKRASNPKNTATLSMVLSITISCLLRFGRNLTSLRILRSLKVLRTESPEPSSVTPYMMPLYNSIALKKNTLVQIFLAFTFLLPKTHNEAIKYIKTITDVLNKTIGCQLKKHLDGEDATEDKIAHFNDLDKSF